MSIIYPGEPEMWRDHMANLGDMEKWVTDDKIGPLPSYISKSVTPFTINIST